MNEEELLDIVGKDSLKEFKAEWENYFDPEHSIERDMALFVRAGRCMFAAGWLARYNDIVNQKRSV